MENGELKYMIFNVSEASKIDMMEVMDQSIEELPKSKDGSKVVVKWERDEVPPTIDALETKEGPYSQAQITSILNGVEWK